MLVLKAESFYNLGYWMLVLKAVMTLQFLDPVSSIQLPVLAAKLVLYYLKQNDLHE